MNHNLYSYKYSVLWLWYSDLEESCRVDSHCSNFTTSHVDVDSIHISLYGVGYITPS